MNRPGRFSLRVRVTATLLIVPLVCATMGGCPDWCETFTQASSSAVQTGLVNILSGVVAGIFAVALSNDSTGTQRTVTFSQGGTDPNSR